jgi:8-amino-7-oxononanoate synthase
MAIEIESADGVHVLAGGRRLVSFAGCDYLGLARHPDVVAAARRTLASCGLGAGASRTTTGTWTAHAELERVLCVWMGTDDCVVLPSGWVAGAALCAALAPGADVVLLDAGAHPALRDAARLTGLPVREFAHFDARAASRAAGAERPIVLTDAVDVTRGALAPLAALKRLAERTGGSLVVDDAHGVGVLGPYGLGTAAALGAGGPRVHVAGSLSKALGAHGGFVTGTRGTCDAIRTRFAGYSGGTPIPPSTAAAAVVAVRLASGGDELRSRLRKNAALLRRRFAAMGLDVPRAGLPWFSVAGRPARALKSMEGALRRDGFLVPYLRYFGAPPEGFLKIAMSAAHKRSHVEALASALETQIGRGPTGPRVPR